jgi:hypothetical protein
MDSKERWLIEELHAKVTNGTYDEFDILALLIILRNSSPKMTPVHEFGDFIAHRQKKIGILKDYLERVQKQLHNLKEVNGSPIKLPIYTVSEIKKSYNDCFASIGLSPLDDEAANQVTVCIISLLQCVEVQTQTTSSVKGLSIGICSEFIGLLGHGDIAAGHGFCFPMLIARNNYEPLPGIDTWMILDNFVTKAYAVGGQFQLEQRKRMS